MTIDQYFVVARTRKRKYRWTRYDQANAVCLVDDLATALADQIVSLRCKNCRSHYEAWKAAAGGGPKPTGVVATALHAFLDPVVGVMGGNPFDRDHLEGFVAEHLWYFLLVHDPSSSTLVRVEPPSFLATDKGGDGFAVRRAADGALQFCLWEIKKRTGKGTSNATINKAVRQLKDKALGYLARYTGTVDVPDEDVRQIYARLIEHWDAASPVAAAGVSVSTTTTLIRPKPFDTFPRHLPKLCVPPRLYGQLAAFSDFGDFAEAVQRVVWTGL